MGKRIMVAVIFVPLIILMLFFAPSWVLPVVVSGLAMIALHEVLWSTGFVKNPKISGLAIVLAGLIPFWVFVGERMLPALVTLFLYVVLLFAVAMKSHYTVTMEKMGGSFFLSIVIPYFLSTFIRIREMPDWRYYILLPFVVAWLSDAFALFAGMAFGKHKLAPELSPKKTVEGAVGGVAGSVAATLIYGFVMSACFGAAAVRYGLLILYALLGAVVAQFGDLAFSYIKRQYDIKDYGTIFPGHGGVLDRFDSVIFCAPLLEILIVYFPAIQGAVG
ncbi:MULTISPECIES: phosphatidate cytidylyltransferase [Intestinimonas]|uniref:phosphatidate cytidylyltransferase n=1 Tax=Intestinimonas TaxID=1392389 RepID=UPI00067F2159|nr:MULTISPECIES: phosphatidate cytidylyltransferase [Intestinimonas]MBS6282929.1 phosphatidate cytidylyltransferase [Oscillospiraceae bacterium]CUQ23571.1 phosphatidate cytidylyltransferase CdsA [Flavonifractor plautii]SCI83655.1 Phosphatidate cytidylyltransferase [uncultured Flavonifractor sp.]MCI5562572.1 phosphatidate cytidylyltransferase [Intestinimonas massiliensis (ex Afouda et al. 2020)]MDY5339028.1 phosphatidate cytidylyltransferase [Intestinimonas sp.]